MLIMSPRISFSQDIPDATGTCVENCGGNVDNSQDNSQDNSTYNSTTYVDPKEVERIRNRHEANESGIQAFNERRWKDAMLLFNKALAYEPNNTVILNNLYASKVRLAHDINDQGIRAYRNQSWDEAIAYYEDALNYRPGDEIILTNLRNAREQKTLQTPTNLHQMPSDKEEKQLKNLIKSSNGDEGVKAYEENIKMLVDVVLKAYDVIVAIGAHDPMDEICILIVQWVEEKVLDKRVEETKKQLHELEDRIESWGNGSDHNSVQKDEALAEIKKMEKWIDKQTQDALQEAHSQINQSNNKVNTDAPKFEMKLNPTAETTSILLKEGSAMRQLRELDKTADWDKLINLK